jgi:outer membrane protein TolC
MMKRTGLFLLALIAATGAFAQDGPGRISFTLDEAQQYAIEHNRTLANASIDIQKVQASRWQTIAGMLPQITASGAYSNMMGYKMNLGQMTISMPPYATFNLQTSLALSGAQIVSLQVSDISRKMADINLHKSEQDIAEQVETLYFSALVIEETIGLLEKNMESLLKLLRITQNSVDVGVAEQTDADQLKLQAASMESTINTTRSSLEMLYNSLRVQLCLEDNTEIVLTESLDDLLSLQRAASLLAENFDIEKNYDYQLIKQNTELARKQIALTGWSNGPSFSIYHQYNGRHNFSNEPTMNMTPPNMIGAQLNIPLFTSGKMSAAMKDARLSYKKQLNQLEDSELALRVQHRQLVFNLKSALEKYDVQKKSVEVAQRVFDKIALKYEHGVSSSMDVTNSGTNLVTAQSNYVQAVLDIVSAQLALEKLLNNR